MSKREKTVQRAYGGSRCGGCVRDRCVAWQTAAASANDHDRIVRAFLVEEAKIVKRVLKQKATSKTSKK